MQSSARLPAAHPHLSQLCELLEFSPLLQWEWELASVSDLPKHQGVWLQSAEHHSSQSAFIFWIIYFWLCWTSANQVYLLKLNLKGKKRLSSIPSMGSRPATPALPHRCAQDTVVEAGSHPPGHLVPALPKQGHRDHLQGRGLRSLPGRSSSERPLSQPGKMFPYVRVEFPVFMLALGLCPVRSAGTAGMSLVISPLFQVSKC